MDRANVNRTSARVYTGCGVLAFADDVLSRICCSSSFLKSPSWKKRSKQASDAASDCYIQRSQKTSARHISSTRSSTAGTRTIEGLNLAGAGVKIKGQKPCTCILKPQTKSTCGHRRTRTHTRTQKITPTQMGRTQFSRKREGKRWSTI